MNGNTNGMTSQCIHNYLNSFHNCRRVLFGDSSTLSDKKVNVLNIKSVMTKIVSFLQGQNVPQDGQFIFERPIDIISKSCRKIA